MKRERKGHIPLAFKLNICRLRVDRRKIIYFSPYYYFRPLRAHGKHDSVVCNKEREERGKTGGGAQTSRDAETTTQGTQNARSAQEDATKGFWCAIPPHFFIILQSNFHVSTNLHKFFTNPSQILHKSSTTFSHIITNLHKPFTTSQNSNSTNLPPRFLLPLRKQYRWVLNAPCHQTVYFV